MQNLRAINQLVQELKSKANEGDIAIFELMLGIKAKEPWKKASFYSGTETNAQEWKAANFSFILRQITGWTMLRYQSIMAILQLQEGRELLLKYGYENMVALKNLSEDERPKVLAAVESHKNKYATMPGFHYIIAKVFPGKRVPVTIENGKELQIKTLKNQIKALKATVAQLEQENKALREQVIKELLEMRK
jgi:hypothetical protein